MVLKNAPDLEWPTRTPKAAAGSETAPPTGKAAAPAPKQGAQGRNRSRRRDARVSFAEQPEVAEEQPSASMALVQSSTNEAAPHDHWELRGTWLVRVHACSRKKTYCLNWRSSKLCSYRPTGR
eukprot:259231-Amphidinium_carterae.1